MKARAFSPVASGLALAVAFCSAGVRVETRHTAAAGLQAPEVNSSQDAAKKPSVADPKDRIRNVRAEKDPRARFKKMDRDRDGRITRSEWRGDAAAFVSHDWNGDGVLSGDEIQPGAPRPVGTTGHQRFDELDVNNDGGVVPEEWQGDPALFDRLDVDRDGRVTRMEFAVPADAAAPRSREQQFTDLDRNRDGRISREEWQGDPAAFDRLDGNGDGILSAIEFFSSNVPVKP